MKASDERSILIEAMVQMTLAAGVVTGVTWVIERILTLSRKTARAIVSLLRVGL